MKYVVGASLCAIAGGVWFIGTQLSSDAIGIVVGFVFGVLAGIPSSLLILAAGRRDSRRDQPAYPQQPPIMIYGGGYQDQQPSFQPPMPQVPQLPTSNQKEYIEW